MERYFDMDHQSPKMAVIGLGFIGLPLALSYAMKGCQVVGIDIDEALVRDINRGVTPLQESHRGQDIDQILQEQLDLGTFRAVTDYAGPARVDNYILTVGIPITGGKPDMSHLESACRSLAGVLKEGDLVLVRSTVVPGTTEDVVRPLLESGGLKAGRDFHLAYSSERIAEGRAFEEFIHMPLAVGGIDDASLDRGTELLSIVTEAEIHPTEIRVVETAKILENMQRDINIALVQELARFAEHAGIDTYEMIRIANTHHRVNLLTPGPGVGGYCLPSALYYLAPAAEQVGVDLSLSFLARSINDRVPVKLADVLENLLGEKDRDITGARVAVLGMAMKDYSSDTRQSPALELIGELADRGADVRVYDPIAPQPIAQRVDSLDACVADAHALVLAARQRPFDNLDWNRVVVRMAPDPVLMDTRNAIPRNLTGATLWRI